MFFEKINFTKSSRYVMSNGGSANIKSNCKLHPNKNFEASDFTVRMLEPSNLVAMDAMKFVHPACRSTAKMDGQPLDASSKEIAPVPANKSRQLQFSKSTLVESRLNNPVRAKSVVGLTGRLGGETMVLPLYLPAMIRKPVRKKD